MSGHVPGRVRYPRPPESDLEYGACPRSQGKRFSNGKRRHGLPEERSYRWQPQPDGRPPVTKKILEKQARIPVQYKESKMGFHGFQHLDWGYSLISRVLTVSCTLSGFTLTGRSTLPRLVKCHVTRHNGSNVNTR